MKVKTLIIISLILALLCAASGCGAETASNSRLTTQKDVSDVLALAAAEGQSIPAASADQTDQSVTVPQSDSADTVPDAAACCAQGIEFVLAGQYSYPADYPEQGSTITVAGVFDTYREGDILYCTLRDAVLYE